MTAHATALLGLDFVRVEELHYGKLVAAEGGHVPMGEGYTTTYRTKGLLHPDRVLPTKLFAGALLQPDRIEEPFRRKGALFFRLVGETLVAMRARYRPEAGEDRPGRTYLQASILQVEAREGFASVPPALIPGFDELLVADPDPITKPAAERIGADPRDERFEFGPRLSRADAAAWEPKQRARITAIIAAMSGAAPIVVGLDSFDDPAQSVDILLKQFLRDIELALTVMAQSRKTVSRDFQIACGLPVEVAGRSLMLSSVNPSTRQSAIGWDDVMQMIELAARSVQGGTGARLGSTSSGTQATVRGPANPPSLSTFERMTDIGWGSPSVRSPPPSAARPPAPEPVLVPPAAVESRDSRLPPDTFKWLVDSAVEPAEEPDDRDTFGISETDSRVVAQSGQIRPLTLRASDALSEFGLKFWYVKCDEPPPGSFASLFEYVAEPSTQHALKNWTPFDTRDPSSPDILLGLLLGVFGRRGDLLDRYAFVEFFSIWRQMKTMIASDKRDNWVARLIKCTDHRISALGALTRKEFQLLRTYKSLYDDSDLSASTKTILAADDTYQGLSSGELVYPEREKRGIVLDAWNRLHRRSTKSNESDSGNLLFSTMDMTPDDTSIFHLADRLQVAQQSGELLSVELDAARELLRRL